MNADIYIARIRSINKRDYALRYLAWLQNEQQGDEPEKGDLSTMAAQGIRLQLHKLRGS